MSPPGDGDGGRRVRWLEEASLLLDQILIERWSGPKEMTGSNPGDYRRMKRVGLEGGLAVGGRGGGGEGLHF